MSDSLTDRFNESYGAYKDEEVPSLYDPSHIGTPERVFSLARQVVGINHIDGITRGKAMGVVGRAMGFFENISDLIDGEPARMDALFGLAHRMPAAPVSGNHVHFFESVVRAIGQEGKLSTLFNMTSLGHNPTVIGCSEGRVTVGACTVALPEGMEEVSYLEAYSQAVEMGLRLQTPWDNRLVREVVRKSFDKKDLERLAVSTWLLTQGLVVDGQDGELQYGKGSKQANVNRSFAYDCFSPVYHAGADDPQCYGWRGAFDLNL